MLRSLFRHGPADTGVAPAVLAEHAPVRADRPVGGNFHHAVPRDCRIFDPSPAEDLGPLQPVFLDDGLDVAAGAVQADTDDLKPFLSVFLVEGLEFLQLCPGRRGGSRPEMEQHHVTENVPGQPHRRPVQARQFSAERSVSVRPSAQPGPEKRRHSGHVVVVPLQLTGQVQHNPPLVVFQRHRHGDHQRAGRHVRLFVSLDKRQNRRAQPSRIVLDLCELGLRENHIRQNPTCGGCVGGGDLSGEVEQGVSRGVVAVEDGHPSRSAEHDVANHVQVSGAGMSSFGLGPQSQDRPVSLDLPDVRKRRIRRDHLPAHLLDHLARHVARVGAFRGGGGGSGLGAACTDKRPGQGPKAQHFARPRRCPFRCDHLPRPKAPHLLSSSAVRRVYHF